MLQHSTFFSPSSGISTSCAESRPPPLQLCQLDCHHGASLGSRPSALYEPFILTGASLRSPPPLSMNHSSLQLLHSEVHPRLYEPFFVTGTSFGNPPQLQVLHLEVHRHSWCFTWKYSPSALHEPHSSLSEKEPISEVLHLAALNLLRTVHLAFTVRSVHGSS